MKQLIQHLLRTNREEIVQKSLLNCHVKGLHSIMLLDCPEKTIRMYIADAHHYLHKNFNSPDSLSFHPHHCELTLHCIYGEFTNVVMSLQNDITGNDCTEYDRWIYNSQISSGLPIGFVKEGSDILRFREKQLVKFGNSVFMPASQIHTVAVEEHQKAAWLVYEGKEWSGYIPYAWSNCDMRNVSGDGLYVKPDFENIVNLLKSVSAI